MEVLIKRLHSHDLPLPEYMTSGSSGLDLYAANPEPISIAPGKIKLIPTGIAAYIPEGYEAQVRPRSLTGPKTG